MARSTQNDRIRRWLEQFDESSKEFSNVMLRNNTESISVLRDEHWASHHDLINNGMFGGKKYPEFENYREFAGHMVSCMKSLLRVYERNINADLHIDAARDAYREAVAIFANIENASQNNNTAIDRSLVKATRAYLDRLEILLSKFFKPIGRAEAKRRVAENHFRKYLKAISL
ncbi:MAG: hypothetical protein P1U42_08350 [Phycisphaerales bacterium]|nr:hypothetical protein [Phycisphaerales bacterium]